MFLCPNRIKGFRQKQLIHFTYSTHHCLLFSLLDDSQLTHAQVILHGLNSLFEACERETLTMLEHVEEIAVPEEWRSTDLVKQTEEVMVCYIE